MIDTRRIAAHYSERVKFAPHDGADEDSALADLIDAVGWELEHSSSAHRYAIRAALTALAKALGVEPAPSTPHNESTPPAVAPLSPE